MVADYADDKAILSIHSDPVVAIQNLQSHLTLMEEWYTKWRVKINQSKSIHTTFTLRLAPCDDVFIYGTLIPSALSTKYLGLTLDKRMTWAHHIKEKIVKLNLRLRLLKSLIFNNKYTHINTKLLIYKSLLKPIWTYGLQLWGNAKKSNLNKIQTFQNKALRNLLNAPPYVSNHSIRSDLKIPLVHDEAKSYYKRFHLRLPSHPNLLARDLSTLTIPAPPNLSSESTPGCEFFFKMSNIPTTRKKLSGAAYRKEAKERQEKEEEVLKKTKRINDYFQQQSGNIPANEISVIENVEVQNEVAYLAMNTRDDFVNSPTPNLPTSTTNIESNPSDLIIQHEPIAEASKLPEPEGKSATHSGFVSSDPAEWIIKDTTLKFYWPEILIKI
ncbi:hypothetical protein QTP88_021438 [Uroleucon formosanum]